MLSQHTRTASDHNRPQIFQRYEERENDARRYIAELTAMAPPSRDHARSPASSSSSFHSSRASPPPDVDQGQQFSPPDPSLPAPDIAPNLIPPSALNTSHRSLATLPYQYDNNSQYSGALQHPPAPSSLRDPYNPPVTSRPGSLFSGVGGSLQPTRDPLANLRGSGRQQPLGPLGYVPEQPGVPPSAGRASVPPRVPSLPPMASAYQPIARDYGTPDLPHLQHQHHGSHGSPYAMHPSPGFPQRPTSVSTFSAAPLNLPATLQQINTSLQALHERLTALEHAQAMLLRKDATKSSWFWANSDEDELDDAEMEQERDRWGYNQPSTTIRLRKKRRGGLTVRVLWALLTGVRRAMIGVGTTVAIAALVIALMNGGWRRQARNIWGKLHLRVVRLLADK